MEGGSPALSPCVNRGEGHSQTMANKLAGSGHAAPPQPTQVIAPSTRTSLPLLLGCPEASHRPGLEQARPEAWPPLQLLLQRLLSERACPCRPPSSSRKH